MDIMLRVTMRVLESRNDYGALGSLVNDERVLQLAWRLFRSCRQPMVTCPES